MSAANTVLIVEDHEWLALGLAARLREIGDEVEIALSWKEALAKVAITPYRVIAIDLALPDSPREVTLSHLQDMHAFRPEVKIVVMSGLPLTMLEMQEAFDHGACLCIEKTAKEFQDAIVALARPKKPRIMFSLSGFAMLAGWLHA